VSRLRVARVISRLNIGGPAIQAISLTSLMEPLGYDTLLVRGSEAGHEGSMDDLAREHGVEPLRIGAMRRDVGPRDAPAFAALVRALRRFGPDIVHTHAAKAGTLGRAAAMAAFPRRPPALVHTFHGHSLSGYFSAPRERVFLRIERALSSRTDRLIAVSEEVRDDLVRMGVARPEKFSVVPLGLDLTRFVLDPGAEARRRAAVRAELGIGEDAPLVVMFARLVPIKRVDRFLDVASAASAELPAARFVVAGDGELREELRQHPAARALGDRLTWTGFRRDVPDVAAAADVVVQTSDNEGTPVSLIEASAAARPVVSTRVGGTASVVRDGETGELRGPDDVAGLAAAITELLRDPARRRSFGAAGRQHVLGKFAQERLVADLDRLYRELV
jgi:glycosyltransferase involved in cell wall biosynthesis